MEIVSASISAILQKIFDDRISDLILQGKDAAAHRGFLKKLTEWCENFISERETEAVAGEGFSRCLQYHRPIENIFEYIKNPKDVAEEKFLEGLILRAEECVFENVQKNVADNSVRDFIVSIFEQVKGFYIGKIKTEDVSLNYHVRQIILKNAEKEIPVNSAPVIQKNFYPYDEKLIARKVMPFKELHETFAFWGNKKGMRDFADVCLREKKVVLLGEAGCGKTVEMRQLAGAVCKNYAEKYPLLFDLSDYTGESVEEILSKNGYFEVKKNELFLMFDGFDEIEEANRNCFARKINDFSEKNHDAVIVISTRNNFYHYAADDGKGSTFKTFKEYGICPLTYDDINAYLSERGISTEHFWAEINKNELSEMAATPFYLCRLAELLAENKNLPVKSGLMEEIIFNRFSKDTEKYVTTKDLEATKYEITANLSKVAFAMQCMHTKTLRAEDYQKLIDKQWRDYLCYSGVFGKNSAGEWEFEHNNFREYLAAKYLCELEFEDIEKVICNKNGEIKESWINVISFLVLIYDGEELLSLITEKDTELLLKFEKSRIPEAERNQIFIKILDSFASRNLWLYTKKSNEKELAEFAQSKVTLEYLITHIKNPKHFRELSNALHVIAGFSNLYSKEDEVRALLLECIKDESVRGEEKKSAMSALAELNLDTDEITGFLLSSCSDACDAYTYGALRYLYESARYEESIDFVLHQYGLIQRRGGNDYNGSIAWCINNIIFQTTGYEAICEIINFFSKGEIRYYDKKDIYNHILKVSVCHYNDGRKEIFNVIYGELESSAKKYSRDFEDMCFEFFSETKTVRDALERLELFYRKNGNDYVILFLIENLLMKAGYSELQALYAEDKRRYSVLMIAVTNSMDVANPAYKENTELLKADGITLPPPRVRINYEEECRRGRTIYFDALFDKNEYGKLMQEMLEFVKKPEITFDEFDGCFSWSDFGGCAREQALLSVAQDISHFEAGNKKVRNFLSLLRDWEEYSIFKIYRVLENTDIELSEAQRGYIENYCRREVASIDFENAIKEEDGSISYSQHLAVTVFLSEKLNISYGKDIYLKMLSFPGFVFDRGNGDNESFSEYVASHLTEREIEKQVLENMREHKLCDYSARVHLRYCKEKNISGAVEYAEFICERSSCDGWTKRRALEYLLEIKGNDYVYEKYLYTEDNSLFEDIVELTWQNKSERLKKRLEEISCDAKESTKYLKILIAMRSRYALQRYYEIAKEKNAIPDYSKSDGYMPLTESIALADELELLPELEKLQKLLFTEGFEDKDTFGLRNSLHKAFQNMAMKYYDEVFAYFETCLGNSELTMEEQSFCNSILQDISAANNLSEDKPWRIREVVRFLVK